MKAGEVVMAVSGNPGLASILRINAYIHDGFVGFRNLSDELLPSNLFILFSRISKNTMILCRSVLFSKT